LPVAGLLYAPADNLRLYATAGKGFETPTLNETAYRADGSTGLNLGLKPSRSNNLEAGAKGRTPAGASTHLEWSAAVFQTATQDEIVSQTNVGGRSTFPERGRHPAPRAGTGLQPGLARRLADAASYTWLDARYRDAFLTCAATPCATPNVAVPAGNRIPGIARTALALEAGWRPARGWRGGVEARYLGSVPSTTSIRTRPPRLPSRRRMWAMRGGGGWKVLGTVRLDNLFDKKYAGSVIVNEGNGRYFEPAAGRTWLLSLTGSYAF
jgi:iron complex outermembrane receptor protein